MNQYDLAPIPPEDREKMRYYIIVGLSALAVFIIAALLLSSCAEREPLPTDNFNAFKI